MADMEQIEVLEANKVVENDTEKINVNDKEHDMTNGLEKSTANDMKQDVTNSAEQFNQNDNPSSLIEQLGKSFNELELHKDALKDKVQWTEIEEHFRNLETVLKKKFEELEAKEKEFQEKEAETLALLAEKEAAVSAKEQDYIDRVQELKDAAVAVITEARASHQQKSADPVDVGDKGESKVSSSLGDTNSPEEDFFLKPGDNAEGVAAEIKPRPELTQFCEQMDAKGLLNYTMENQKNLYAICRELSVALECAADPARLVLDLLEGFYPPDGTNQPGENGDAALQGMQKACLMFMEAMSALLLRVDPGADHLLNPETKQQAKAIADEWKPKLAIADTDAANGISLEVEAFLKLLTTFRIASEFDGEELCKLVLAVAHRRQAPELCRPLGLTDKVPGIVESLINSGRQVDAVHFIHAFQLSDSFPPVPILKTYLKDLRRDSQGKGGDIGGSDGMQKDANAEELTALKAVIKCVEEFKLGADYPLDPLQKRVAQLEKSRSDKKRGREFVKYKNQKKLKANKGPYGSRAPGIAAARQAPPVFGDTTSYSGMLDRYPPAGPSPYDYQYPSQSGYAQQGNDQRLYYHHPPGERVMATSYNQAPSGYGYIGSQMPSTYQPYM